MKTFSWRASRFANIAIVAVALLSASCGYAQDGAFDTNFLRGFQGKTFAASQLPIINASFLPVGAQIAADDGIVIGGVCTSISGSTFSGSIFCLVKVAADGNSAQFSSLASSQNRLNPASKGDVAIQADGKIVVAAACRAFTVSTQDSMCVARFNADLSVDTTFAVGFAGNVQPGAAFSGPSEPNVLALQPDGKILVGGKCTGANGALMCVSRLQTDGQSDAGFGATATVSFFPNRTPNNVAATRGIHFTGDGKIVLTGECRTGVAPNDVNRFCIGRLNLADGSFDSTINAGSGNQPAFFGVFGTAANSDNLFGSALLPNQQLLLYGGCDQPANTNLFNTSRSCATRLDINSRFSLFWGTSFPGAPNPSSPDSRLFDANRVSIAHVSLLPGGRFYAAETAGRSNNSGRVRRYNEDGSTDALWTSTGIDYNDVGGGITGAEPIRVLIQSSGRVILVGLIVRTGGQILPILHGFNGRQPARAQCSMDIDDDGRVNATTDGLLFARAMLGLSGVAVTSGAVPASGARRANWTAIRDYLRYQCGLNVAN